MKLEINKNANLESTQIEKLRVAVGWNRLEGKYQTALEGSFAHYSILEEQELIAFARDHQRWCNLRFDCGCDGSPSISNSRFGKKNARVCN
jgi:hypothetical protein